MTTAIKINVNDGKTRNVMTGGETTVDFDFPIFDADHVRIIETDTSGNIVELVKDTDFTVPSSSVNQQAGGTVTLDSGIYPSGATAGHVFTALQNAPNARTTDFNQAGDFFADTLNQELDQLTQQMQQINRDLSRAILGPEDTTLVSFATPTPENNKVLSWDGITGALKNVTPSSFGDDMDVLLTSLSDGDFLVYNGAAWENQTVNEVKATFGLRLNNFSATAAPSATNDENEGYAVGSQWYDQTNDDMYHCMDATASAAVWVQGDIVAADLGGMALLDKADQTLAAAGANNVTGMTPFLTKKSIDTFSSPVWTYVDLEDDLATNNSSNVAFSSIPSTANEIEIFFDNVEYSANSGVLITLTDTAEKVSGYDGRVIGGTDGSTHYDAYFDTAFLAYAATGAFAAGQYSGKVVLDKISDGNKWLLSSFLTNIDNSSNRGGSTHSELIVSLSSALTALNIKTSAGSFDSGAIIARYR